MPLMALTSTATERVRRDIFERLRMAADAHVYVGPFDRPNLTFKALVKKSAGASFDLLRRELMDPVCQPSSTIIYCPTTDDVDGLHGFLVAGLPLELHGAGCEVSCEAWPRRKRR